MTLLQKELYNDGCNGMMYPPAILKLVQRNPTSSSPSCLTLCKNNTIIKNYSIDDIFQAETDFTNYYNQFKK